MEGEIKGKREEERNERKRLEDRMKEIKGRGARRKGMVCSFLYSIPMNSNDYLWRWMLLLGWEGNAPMSLNMSNDNTVN